MRTVVFFDLDGTLIDDSERQYRVYKGVLDSLGIRNYLSRERFWIQKRSGCKTVELLPKDSAEESIAKFSTEWLRKIEDKRYLTYDSMFPKSTDVLSELKDKVDLVLATMRNNEKNLFWELNKFGLIKYFKEILVGSSFKTDDKTSLLNSYIGRYSKKGNFIIVGDTEVDIAVGKALGMLQIAVAHGIRSADFLKNFGPSACLDDLSGIIGIVGKIGQRL